MKKRRVDAVTNGDAWSNPRLGLVSQISVTLGPLSLDNKTIVDI
jgi:hypothetical protein